MINLAQSSTQKLKLFFCMIVSILVLQGCGGQREAPFMSDSSSSSRGAAIDVVSLTTGTAAVGDVNDQDKIIKIRDIDDFTTYWQLYTSEALPTVSWSTGQVLLIDLGRKTNCERKLTLKTVSAFDGSVNSVIVVIDLTDKDTSSTSSSSTSSGSSSSSSSSICSDTGPTQPYYFYFVKSRDEMIVEENVP